MDRRTFLKTAGLGSVSFAFGCRPLDDKKLYTLVRAPDDMVSGDARWYASTCQECPAGCGVIAKNREGRVIKLEGNPGHPVNQGKLCIRGQAALQAVYDPDRLPVPLLKVKGQFTPISYEDAFRHIQEHAEAAAANGPNRVRMVTGIMGGPLQDLANAVLKRYNSGPVLMYEPFSYDSLRIAHQELLSQASLPSFAMEKADFLLCFGADFLETWLSPVEYARKFKAMHASHHGHKGFFAHVGTHMSLTASNADIFIAVRPGSEYCVALGIVKSLLESRTPEHLAPEVAQQIRELVDGYDPVSVEALSGFKASDHLRLMQRLENARHPLVLGSGSLSFGEASPMLDMAVTLINILQDEYLSLYDFDARHPLEKAALGTKAADFFREAAAADPGLILMYNTNPIFTLPLEPGVQALMDRSDIFKVCFSNTMDETAEKADLIVPVQLALETWDVYESNSGVVSSCQPAMGHLTQAPSLGNVLLGLSLQNHRFADYRAYLKAIFYPGSGNEQLESWYRMLQQGGLFGGGTRKEMTKVQLDKNAVKALKKALAFVTPPKSEGITFLAVPSLRHFDGRGANRAWLNEIPDPITSTAWDTLLMMHPDTLAQKGLDQGNRVRLETPNASLEALVYAYDGVHPSAAVMPIGQGHTAYGRFAKGYGVNPLDLLAGTSIPGQAALNYSTRLTRLEKAGPAETFPKTDGSRSQYKRKIALSMVTDHGDNAHHAKEGLTMDTFPFTLPTPEGYDPKRDVYAPHTHDGYRWGLAIDLDRCIGCSACVAACYAENNIGVVGRQQIINGREMSWIRIERYQDQNRNERLIFLPMMCQQCDNAPCESVCPVYAPHHSKEGINNQIYNRCIGTRFCAQNCPYKVRRFNWFDWKWPSPLELQLNPNVTVRSKGVMEKCSLCIQRIKEAHGKAKDRKGTIRDGEIQPACVQTCPTNALVFGNFLDKGSRLYELTQSPRAYQVLGYLNTKPGVIYLKKELQEL